MSYLIVKWRGEEVDRFELTEAVMVGRDFSCQVWLNDPTLSRQHCEISPAGCGTWMIADLGSRNGVLVDDRPVKRRVLRDGQVIRVGDATIAFCEEALVARRPATPREAIERSMMQSRQTAGRGGPVPAHAARQVLAGPPTARHLNRHDPLTQPFGLAFQRPPAQPRLDEQPSRDLPPRRESPRGAFGSILLALRSLLGGKRDAA